MSDILIWVMVPWVDTPVKIYQAVYLDLCILLYLLQYEKSVKAFVEKVIKLVGRD